MTNIIQKDTTHWEIFFEGLPDWCIPLIKIVPQFYTIDQYNDNWDNLLLDYSFNYVWEKVDDINYRLYLRLSGQLRNELSETIPLYVDLSLWIINTQSRESTQHQLGY